MTAQTVTRDEFEDVKQLLASAARYAESANARLDRVAAQQELNTSAIAVLTHKQDQLIERIDQLTERVDQLTSRVDQLAGVVNQLAVEVGELRMTVEIQAETAAQDRSQAQIDRAEFRTTVTQLLEVLTRQFNGNGRGEG